MHSEFVALETTRVCCVEPQQNYYSTDLELMAIQSEVKFYGYGALSLSFHPQ